MSSETVADVIETVAFRCPDGSEVLIAMNPTTSSTWFDVVRGGQYLSYRLTGRSVVTFVWQSHTPGDLNCDGLIDGADISSLVLALLDPSQYAGQNPACEILAGDLDLDGAVTPLDLPPFIQLLLGN